MDAQFYEFVERGIQKNPANKLSRIRDYSKENRYANDMLHSDSNLPARLQNELQRKKRKVKISSWLSENGVMGHKLCQFHGHSEKSLVQCAFERRFTIPSDGESRAYSVTRPRGLQRSLP